MLRGIDGKDKLIEGTVSKKGKRNTFHYITNHKLNFNYDVYIYC